MQSLVVLCILFLSVLSNVQAQVQYNGVNLAGADFGTGNLPGEFGSDYTYPTHEEVDYFTDKGMNVFRLPFMWERIQNDQNGPLNIAELARIKDFVDYATSKQAKVILDPHNGARYYGEVIGIDGDLGAVPVAAFVDFWTKLALEFKDNSAVIFGLINEPNTMPTELWLEDANAAIAAIRTTGANNLILVPGNAWTGAHSWLDNWYGTPNGTVMQGIVDPGNHYAIEAHQYMDSDSSGTSANCVSTTIGSERLQVFTDWLREHNEIGFLGEFAGGRNATCSAGLDDMLDFIDANADVWLGWTYWAAGPWWGEDIFTLEPKADGTDRPQMAVLQEHISPIPPIDPPVDPPANPAPTPDKPKITAAIVPILMSLLSGDTSSDPIDTDGDGISDTNDNCPAAANPGQTNTDGDGQGDACDTDDDNDGMPDEWETDHGLNPLDASDAGENPDGDDFSNLQEYQNGTDPNVDDGVSVNIAEQQAARFLAQATFGPTNDAISALVNQNSYSSWLAAQIALPASFHLPGVKLIAPDGRDTQRARYPVWWNAALHADDQLRQRVAFALSEIIVVSDRPDALINHGNMLAAYYDLLVEHAFGNFRDLLKAVTLSPAMGIYLSMLGNETMQGRADENYAREVLQLFSIGLVHLNLDGSPSLANDGNPKPTYTQADIANLARVFTGWTWDRAEFNPGPIDGWYPDIGRMEIPMKAFADHHDTESKVFLGTTVPARQSAGEDLDAAMDAIYNHPNVGPFIGKQLIQRLVTSNPSSGYISRVAAVFNDDGFGERGNLAAVVKAILLDLEARSENMAQTDDYGKLREPILRFSHLWRAFRVQDPIEMDHFGNLMSQHAPLTANSVFNFFKPGYSPPGEITEAGLVAPEFQLDSEAWVSSINNLLINIVQADGFYQLFQTRLDLSAELALISTPQQLIDHLDLLLMSSSMSDSFEQLLLDYITQNQSIVANERLVRDVITLIITSAEYSVQR